MAAIARWATRTVASAEDGAVWLGTRHGLLLLRLSIGVVYLWFALPKYVPGLSAADPLARQTIGVLTGQLITGNLAVLLLALLETAIGVGMLTGLLPRLTLAALMFQLAGTLTPLALFPEQAWKAPFVLSLDGQFIIKNLVLIAAALAVAGGLKRATGSSESPAVPAASEPAASPPAVSASAVSASAVSASAVSASAVPASSTPGGAVPAARDPRGGKLARAGRLAARRNRSSINQPHERGKFHV